MSSLLAPADGCRCCCAAGSTYDGGLGEDQWSRLSACSGSISRGSRTDSMGTWAYMVSSAWRTAAAGRWCRRRPRSFCARSSSAPTRTGHFWPVMSQGVCFCCSAGRRKEGFYKSGALVYTYHIPHDLFCWLYPEDALTYEKTRRWNAINTICVVI